MIRAAFFDIDDTLLAHSIGGVPEDTKCALARLKERGVRVFTCTGRHILELNELGITELGFDGHVLLNGQLCLDGKGRVLAQWPVYEEDIQSILPIFREKVVPMSFVEQGRIYLNFIDDRVRTAQQAISSELPKLGDWKGDRVYLVNVYDDDEAAEKILNRMPHCKMTRWNAYGVDIIAKAGGKEKGMEQILSGMGILPEETIAFGDGENDMGMLRFAGIGVAMGNSEERVKACADYVTKDADQGGILSALRHFKIL